MAAALLKLAAASAQSTEKKRKKKPPAQRTLTQMCRELLEGTAPPGSAFFEGLKPAAAEFAAARNRPLNLYETMLLAQLEKAIMGDTRAAAFIRDSAGVKQEETPPAQGLSAGDAALLQKLSRRLGKEEKVNG